MSIRARITLKDGGPLSYDLRGRRLQRGESVTITSRHDIVYAFNSGMCDVTFLQGSIEGVSPALADEPPQEATEEASEEAGLEEGLDDSSEEQDAHPGEEGDGEEDGGEEAAEDGGGEDGGGEELPTLTHDSLNGMSKQGIIDEAAKYGLGVALKLSMRKEAMIDMVMEAYSAKVEEA